MTMDKVLSYNLNDIFNKVNVSWDNKDVMLASTYFSHYNESTATYSHNIIDITREDFIIQASRCADIAFKTYMRLQGYIMKLCVYNRCLNMQQKHEEKLKSVSDYAEQRYTRNYYKNLYIYKSITAFDLEMLSNINVFRESRKPKTFTFDENFGLSNTTSHYGFSDVESGENAFGRIYDAIRGNVIYPHIQKLKFLVKHFDKNLLTYETGLDGIIMEFSFDPDGEKIVEDNKESLIRAIENFYSNSKYFGD